MCLSPGKSSVIDFVPQVIQCGPQMAPVFIKRMENPLLDMLGEIERAVCLHSAQATEPQALLMMLKEKPEGNDLASYPVSDRIHQALTIWLPK